MTSQNTYFPPLPNGYSFGNYRIEYLLKQDEMGVTYVAWDTERTAWAFVKENLPQASSLREADGVQVKARRGMEDHYLRHLSDFYQEADTMSKLDHPGVAKVLRFFRSGGTAYYVLPCDGEMTLGQWFDSKGKPERALLLKWVRSMVETLGYLHRQELGPWDITPGSFMIKPDGSPVLVEFSVLRRLIGGNVDLIKSSPGYAAIELVKGENVGPWTDFYALGVTLYELLTDEPLQSCKNRRKSDMLIPLHNRPTLLSVYGKALLRCIDKAMAFEPADRWQSADEWLEALDAIPDTEELLFCDLPDSPPAEEGPKETPKVEPKDSKMEKKPQQPAVPVETPKPVAAPVEPEPAPLEDEPLFPESLYRDPDADRSSTGGIVAIAAGVLLAAAGACAWIFWTPQEVVSIESEAKAPETEVSAAEEQQPATPVPAQPAPAVVQKPAVPATPPAPATSVPEVKPEPVKPAPATPAPVVTKPTQPAPAEPVKPAQSASTPVATTPSTSAPAVTAIVTTAPASAAKNLVEAAKNGAVSAAARFLEQGASEKEIHEALGAAVIRGDAALVTLLLDKGADLKKDTRYDGKMNALGLAVSQGDAEMVELLLDRNSPRNSRYDGKTTALMMAARAGNVRIVKALLDKKANTIFQNEDGDTALIIAVREGHVECAKLIIAARADVNLANKKGERAIDCAKSTPKLDDKQRAAMVRLLKANGAKG